MTANANKKNTPDTRIAYDLFDWLREMKANIVGAAFLIELVDLKGRDKLPDIPIFTLIKY